MFKRVRNTCIRVLQSTSTVDTYGMLLWLQEHTTLNGETTPSKLSKQTCTQQTIIDDNMKENFRLVLFSSEDPPYLTVVKLEMLKYFVREDNLSMILDNIKTIVFTQYSNSHACEKAIQTLIHLRDTFFEPCKAAFDDILKSGQLEIYQVILQYLHLITSYDSSESEHVFNITLPHWRSLKGCDIMVLVHLCSNFAHKDKLNIVYMQDICEFLCSPSSKAGYDLKSALLSSLLQCFKAQPAEYQALLREVMCEFDESGDLILQQHVKWCAQKVLKL